MEDNHEICPICLEHIIHGTKATLNCNHSFHIDCFDTLRSIYTTCPVCRNEFQESVNTYIQEEDDEDDEDLDDDILDRHERFYLYASFNLKNILRNIFEIRKQNLLYFTILLLLVLIFFMQMKMN